jgi:serine protease Do
MKKVLSMLLVMVMIFSLSVFATETEQTTGVAEAIVEEPEQIYFKAKVIEASEVGEKVYTIGSPLGLENTFSSGEISQLREDNLIQINAPIDHGSSGGALINEYGEVIGITTAGIESSGANLNFAVDIDVVRPYVR